MRTALVYGLWTVMSISIAAPASAAQPVIPTPAVPIILPNLLYEIDYAVSAGYAQSTAPVAVNTIVSLGLPAQTSQANGCELQVKWLDWNGAVAGYSGPALLVIGETLEFTSSGNVGNPMEYHPFTENVFRNVAAAFEGHAQIYSSCPVTTKLRADAEFVTATTPATGGPASFEYKSINITNPKGVIGY